MPFADRAKGKRNITWPQPGLRADRIEKLGRTTVFSTVCLRPARLMPRDLVPVEHSMAVSVIALNPATEFSALKYLLPKCDLVIGEVFSVLRNIEFNGAGAFRKLPSKLCFVDFF